MLAIEPWAFAASGWANYHKRNAFPGFLVLCERVVIAGWDLRQDR
jgi:hypothetical protein